MAKRAELPKAEISGKLPELPAGCAWYENYEIEGFRFHIAVPQNAAGSAALCGGDESLAADFFSRGWRIAVSANLDARQRMKDAKTSGKLQEVAAEIQREIFAFDPKAKRRAAAPAAVSAQVLAAAYKEAKGDLSKLQEILKSKGVNVTA